ncbi:MULTISPECIES: ATP-binding protein [unclassified Polaribacter]|uniref:ATP-binding protein n=1 Tax=unclassified Polaribacter TaxID=196858 RepID=UPI0011BF1915|nr:MULTISPECIES: ATP-binding protein [unclassified Polaribacter]TXD50496.1 transcriptional regulator [Polaribacter sp. IC063]TXD61040.1 transcriptional regulator [Polaribacter sp. IC066]
MTENSEYDQKSLRLVKGKTADWDELAKDCVAFANGRGGFIYIGIEDGEDEPPTNQIVSDDLLEKVRKIIPQRNISVAIFVSRIIRENSGQIIKLEIMRSVQSIAATTNGRYYIRISDESKPIMPDELSRVAAEKQAFIWEEKVVRKVPYQNAEPNRIQQFIKDLKNSNRVSEFVKEMPLEELLEYYFFISDGLLTNLGILWLGERKERASIYYAPSIQFIKYDENEKKINKIIWDDFTLNPKQLLAEIIALSDWKESIEISDGLFRKNIPNYDVEIIRELIVNALVHRIYTMRGDIFINLYHDRLEIHSPGLLPLGVTPNNIISKSIYRNTHLAKVFYDLQLMEKEGSGYDKVYELLLFNGKPEPLVEEWDDRVVVTVKKNIISKEVVHLMSKINNDYLLTQKEIIALGLIAQSNSMPTTFLSKKLSLRNDDSLKYWIGGLIKEDIILSKGKTKATEYFVNPELLKQLDFKGKTDLKNIESHRLEQLILEDLRIYQPCSISDLHQRIGKEINQKKVKRQLDKMIEEAKIEGVGEKRWRTYKALK